MTSMTIAKTRDSLSSIIGGIERGEIAEHLIKNRDRVVARILPVEGEAITANRIGVSKGDPFLIDDDAFDAMDAEIADAFGA